jgi:hypothetical protein
MTLPEADPAEHAPDVAVVLARGLERIECPTVHEPEVADAHRDFDVGHPPEQPIEGRGRPFLEGRLSRSLRTHGIDDIEASRQRAAI